MTILDRYIVRQFLINFTILMFVFLSLFVLIDLVVNLDEFLKAGQEVALQNAMREVPDEGTGLAATSELPVSRWQRLWALVWVIWDWHGPMMTLLYVYLCGLLMVAAMGFTFADLMTKRELVAMLTSGISMYRIAAPVIVVGGALNLAALPIQEYVVPRLASKLVRSHRQIGHIGIRNFDVQFAPDGAGNLISAAQFDSEHNMLEAPIIVSRKPGGGPASVISAEQAWWNGSDKGWDLVQGHLHCSVVADQVESSDPDEPTDVPQIAFFKTSLTPQTLIARRAEIYPTLLSVGELLRLRQNKAIDVDRVSRIMWQRFSLLVVNMMIFLMGMPYFLSREPVNLLLQAVRSAFLTVGTWGSSMVMLQVSGAHLQPFAAAWLPVIVIVPITVWVMGRIRT